MHDKFGNKVITTEHIAQALGHKPKSGGFNQKIADLKAYGLIDGSRGSYQVSDTGSKATFGNKVEMDDALDKAVKRIDLWRIIYEKCGKEPDQETFWIDLAEITGIPRPESQKKADAVRKAYIEDIKYLFSVEKLVLPPESQNVEARAIEAIGRTSGMTTTQMEPALTGGVAVIQFPEFGESRVVIRDKKSLKTIRRFLDDLEEFLNSESEGHVDQ